LIGIDEVLIAADLLLRYTHVGSVKNVESFKLNNFSSHLNMCKEYMSGKGVDLGSGYAKYISEHNGTEGIVTVDYNPLCEATITGDMFAKETIDKLMEIGPFNYIICSMSINTEEDLNDLIAVAERILVKDGYIILVIGESEKLAHVDIETNTLPKYRLSFYLSKLSQEKVDDALSKHRFTKCFGNPAADIDDIDDVESTTYTSLSIWKRNI
jgi:hypothetical protein